MSYFILSHHLDLAAFALCLLGLMTFVHLWLRRSTGLRGFSRTGWCALAGIIALGICLAVGSGNAEDRRLQHTISGMAPTYADEMARAGLQAINEKTAPDDPAYTALINTQIRWEKDNPGIADIYVISRRADGKFFFLVDSETDYNRNGAIDEDREARTPIGEVYEEDEDLLEQAITGTAVFTPKPTTDRWGTWISTYVPVFDKDGKPFAVLGVDFDASEYVHSILWHRGAMLAFAGMIGIILIASLALLATLRGEMAKREVLHRQLVDASRRAGMADIATGVLHNVGNALNSVNTSAALISEKIAAGAGVDSAELAQIADMFKQHAADLGAFFKSHDVGRQLPAYFAALAAASAQEHALLTREIQTLASGIDHIKGIVRAQQTVASAHAYADAADPVDLFDEAVRLSQLDPSAITLERQYQPLPGLNLDRHKILQILVNLLTNAVHAVAGVKNPQIILRLALEDGHVLWQVRDNGAGIAPENLEQIFRHGFTTRKDGHGFGLHSAANAAAEMQGTLTARSDGPGRGAAFTLKLPALITQEAAA